MKLHPEITCPLCRIQFGNYKIGEKVKHIDILWSSEAGLVKDCQDPDTVRSNIENVDEYGNPEFKEDFHRKLADLRYHFENHPSDITKDSFDFDTYMLAFIECMNYGYVEGDDEEYDRENITTEKLKQLWERGYNLNESLRAFIVKTA